MLDRRPEGRNRLAVACSPFRNLNEILLRRSERGEIDENYGGPRKYEVCNRLAVTCSPPQRIDRDIVEEEK